MTDDGAFRMMAVRTTDTVRSVLRAQGLDVGTPEARLLGEMVTGAILFRETMSPTLRVQGVLKGAAGSGTLIADSHPDGWSRGLVQRRPEAPSFRLGAGAVLQMMRSLPNGELHQGVVEADERGFDDALMGYMQLSEQIETVVRCAVIVEDGELKAAGGYLVQLLPEAPDREAAVMILAQRLEDDFDDIRGRLVATDASPDHLIEEVFYGMPYTPLGDSEVRAGCDCSHVRILAGLSTLGPDDLQEMVDAGAPLEIGCDWCGAEYRVEVEALRHLLTSS
ncbi:MAG: Hsp33 family molecular chaperone HslO [Myxococcales bacterium]|nr:Hsp33 family molecular chaperone HslO [Myxococcales bacterium]